MNTFEKKCEDKNEVKSSRTPFIERFPKREFLLMVVSFPNLVECFYAAHVKLCWWICFRLFDNFYVTKKQYYTTKHGHPCLILQVLFCPLLYSIKFNYFFYERKATLGNRRDERSALLPWTWNYVTGSPTLRAYFATFLGDFVVVIFLSLVLRLDSVLNFNAA